MATVTSADGTTIGYDRIGTGPAVILIDAAAGFRKFGPMPPLAARLASNFTVYTYDRRGRGESTDTQPYKVEREVDDLSAIIDATGGSACLYGFSSGAMLALYAAARGLSVTRIALLEPPLDLENAPDSDPAPSAQIRELVAAGRRGDAVELFQNSIGVPADMTAGMRQSPMWPTMESIAHTLPYDLAISGSRPDVPLSEITVPALVMVSEASDERLSRWAKGVAEALPNAELRVMKGEWHGVVEDDLVQTLTAFFAG